MLKARFSRSLLAAVGLLALVLACYPESLLPEASIPDVPTRSSTSASTSTAQVTEVGPTLTEEPVVTPLDPQTGIDAVTRALQGRSAQSLSDLLLNQVLLAQGPNGYQGQTVAREEAVQWLNARWGRQRLVVSTDYVEHVVLLEVKTSGWVRLAPVQSGVIVFNLHRYSGQAQADPLRGSWRIDAILYQ